MVEHDMGLIMDISNHVVVLNFGRVLNLAVGEMLDRAPAHLRARYLPLVVRGELVGAFATSEPDASTDVSLGMMRTTATEVAGGWRINGRELAG